MTTDGRYPVVVLAAGEGRRLGRQKALATCRGVTFLTMILDTLAAVPARPVFVVVGHQQEAVRRAHRNHPDVTFLVNDRPQDGQISSLQRVLQCRTSRWRGVLVTLVDHPAVAVDSFSTMLRVAGSHPGSIIVATSCGRRGHPVVFPASLFQDLLSPDLPEGARTVMRRHAGDILEVPLNDPGVVVDVDTPADMESLKKYLSGRRPPLYNRNLEER